MPTKSPSKGDVGWKIITSAFDLASQQGWRNVTLAAIARESGQKLDRVVTEFPSKQAILAAFNRRIDAETLKERIEDDGTVKDRLFELIMRRLDALAPHREAIRAILRDTVGVDPIASMLGLCTLHRSMVIILEAAGVSASGPIGRLRANALGAIYLRTLSFWLREGDGTNDRVMADLDKSLSCAERLASSLGVRARWRRRSEPSDYEAGAATAADSADSPG